MHGMYQGLRYYRATQIINTLKTYVMTAQEHTSSVGGFSRALSLVLSFCLGLGLGIMKALKRQDRCRQCRMSDEKKYANVKMAWSVHEN